MNKSNKSEKDRVNVKLQKTIANLISNVISSLCQQVVQYERSIDIFGLLCINIDDDVDISIKLNEKFIKKEIVSTNTNTDYSKLMDIIQKNDISKALEEVTGGMETVRNSLEMEVDNKENDYPILIDETEKSSIQKRRPRKPQQTFRHIIVDETTNGKNESDKMKPLTPTSDSELKIDTQFEFTPHNSKVPKIEFMNKSIETDESDEKLCNESVESIVKISPTSSVINVDETPCNLDNVRTSTSKTNQTYKCTICDRQFKRKFCLTRHKRVHQNYKSYLCNVCGLGFDLINQLKRHLRNTHACSRENLRRSCRNSQKTEESIKSSTNADQFCSIEYGWQIPKQTTNSQMPLLPVKQVPASTNSSDCLTTKSICFNQFSFPPGLIVTNSVKKPSSSGFNQTFPTPTSVSTQYQLRQMYNPITDPGFYYINNYTHIMPTTNNNLYSTHTVANGNTPKSMPNLSSAPSTTNTITLTNTNSQRLPIYRFPSTSFTSPSLKSNPLPINNNWNSGIVRTPDSIHSDKVKQPASPVKSLNQGGKSVE